MVEKIKEIELEWINTTPPDFKRSPWEWQDQLDPWINVRWGSSWSTMKPINTSVSGWTSTTNIVFSWNPTYVKLEAVSAATWWVMSFGWADGTTNYCHFWGQGAFATSFNNARCIDIADWTNTFKATATLSWNTLTLTWTSSSWWPIYLTAYPY